MFNNLVNWLEQHPMKCPSKHWLGIDCPGCGMQRSFTELLQGNLKESLQLYPGLIPEMLLVIFLVLHVVFKFRNGATILKFSFIFTAAIIVINYIYKLITHNI